MEKMSSLTFPDGSTYEIVDAEARMEVSKTQEVTTDKFNSDIDYAAGDLCIYNNVLYKFITSKSAGEWDSEAVEVTSVKNEMNNLQNQVNALNSKIGYIDNDTFYINSGTTKELPIENSKLYIVSTSGEYSPAYSCCIAGYSRVNGGVIQPLKESSYITIEVESEKLRIITKSGLSTIGLSITKLN